MLTLTAALLGTVLVADSKENATADALKIHGQTSVLVCGGTAVIRSGQDLVLRSVSSGNQEMITAHVAGLLKVNSINWNKQMLIVIHGGTQPTGGYSVELKSLEIKDGKLHVHWKLNKPAPDALVTQVQSYPELLVLVDRFDGEIVFDPLPTKN